MLSFLSPSTSLPSLLLITVGSFHRLVHSYSLFFFLPPLIFFLSCFFPLISLMSVLFSFCFPSVSHSLSCLSLLLRTSDYSDPFTRAAVSKLISVLSVLSFIDSALPPLYATYFPFTSSSFAFSHFTSSPLLLSLCLLLFFDLARGNTPTIPRLSDITMKESKQTQTFHPSFHYRFLNAGSSITCFQLVQLHHHHRFLLPPPLPPLSSSLLFSHSVSVHFQFSFLFPCFSMFSPRIHSFVLCLPVCSLILLFCRLNSPSVLSSVVRLLNMDTATQYPDLTFAAVHCLWAWSLHPQVCLQPFLSAFFRCFLAPLSLFALLCCSLLFCLYCAVIIHYFLSLSCISCLACLLVLVCLCLCLFTFFCSLNSHCVSL